jgi:hypothetical protein
LFDVGDIEMKVMGVLGIDKKKDVKKEAPPSLKGISF